MKRKNIIAIIVCVSAIILLFVFHFVDGGTINSGTWSKTPIDNLKEFSGAGITYQELETVYLGENGKDGALLFYLEQKENTNEPLFKVGFFESKYESGEYVYTHYSSYAQLNATLKENSMLIKSLSDGSKFNYFVGLSQLDESDIYEEFPNFIDSKINTVQFEIDGISYSIKYIIKSFKSETEVLSFESFINYQQ